MSPAWLSHLRDRLRARRQPDLRDAELRARALRADDLLRAGRREQAMAEYLAVFASDPGLLVELGGELDQVAREMGGAVWLDYRLAGIRAALEQPAVADDDEVREAYGELLDEHRGDPDAVTRIRAVGRLIDEAVERGDLPRALIRRGPR
jgi:hypothetical protein